MDLGDSDGAGCAPAAAAVVPLEASTIARATGLGSGVPSAADLGRSCAGANPGDPPSEDVVDVDATDRDWMESEGTAVDCVAVGPIQSLVYPELHAAHGRWVAGRASRGFVPLATTPLSKVQRQLVRELVGASAAAIVRPENKGRMKLVGADFLRLGGVAWLSGEVMNSFVALVNARDDRGRLRSTTADSSNKPSTLPRTRMLNTHFFSRLCLRRGHYCYDNVRRWGTKAGVDLENVDNIIIPVHLNNAHWLLVVVDVAKRAFVFYDSLSLTDAEDAVGVVRRWLSDEALARLGSAASTRWAVDTWEVVVDPTTPRQSDAGSCGVFALAAADCFSLGVPLSFSQSEVPTLRQRIALALFFDDLDCDLDVSHCVRLTAVAPSDSDEEGPAFSSDVDEVFSASEGDDGDSDAGDPGGTAGEDDGGVFVDGDAGVAASVIAPGGE